MAWVLETVGLTRTFGQVVAAEDVTVRIQTGERVGIVGPNGAGKTTFLNLVTGYLKPQRGCILYMGQDITGWSPRAITRAGVARTFQIPQIFPNLTVLENVLVALATREGKGLDFWRPLRRNPWVDEAQETLSHFGLQDDLHRPARELSEGGRKLLDVAISFVLQPQLLLMDEPTSGVSMREKFAVMDTIVDRIEQMGVTTVFVEHDMEVVIRYAQRVLVFDNGRVIADGAPETVFQETHIRQMVTG